MTTTRVTQAELLEVYRIALILLGSYSTIRIDATTRDDFGEVVVYYSVPYVDDGQERLIYQGYPKDFTLRD